MDENNFDISDVLVQDALENVMIIQKEGVSIFRLVRLNDEMLHFPTRRHTHLFRKTFQHEPRFPICKTSLPIFIPHSPRKLEFQDV